MTYSMPMEVWCYDDCIEKMQPPRGKHCNSGCLACRQRTPQLAAWESGSCVAPGHQSCSGYPFPLDPLAACVYQSKCRSRL